MRFDISGRGNTDLGTVTLNAAAVQVRAVRNAETKEVLSMETQTLKLWLLNWKNFYRWLRSRRYSY